MAPTNLKKLAAKQAGKLRTAMDALIAEDADEKPDLFVTMDFDGDGWDVWFASPFGWASSLGELCHQE